MINQNIVERILVFGASSWLGYLLLKNLESTKHILGGTYFNNKIKISSSIEFYRVSNLNSAKDVLKTFKPSVVINFLRGEDDNGMLLHLDLIEYSRHHNLYYLYASSILALDGYSYSTQLTESIAPNSVSPYGIFKAKSEEKLTNSSINWCVLRFASVQGWVPHKITRNEFLLQNLKEKKSITVDRGVVQNRMFADLLIDGIIKIITKKTEGIIHFGARDASEEIDFLKSQAKLFGYSTKLIKEGKERKVNLVAIPGRIYEILGPKYSVYEKDTLNSIKQTVGLQKYQKV